MKWRGRRGREGIKQKGQHALLRESVLGRRIRETGVITSECGAHMVRVHTAALKCQID